VNFDADGSFFLSTCIHHDSVTWPTLNKIPVDEPSVDTLRKLISEQKFDLVAGEL
jgi:hypothetical protein